MIVKVAMDSLNDSKQQLRVKFAEFARTRDPSLREELVRSHLGLAEYLSRRFANRGESHEDLFQVGSLALIKAVDRFDPRRDVEFSTFATHTIAGELKRHFRDRAWAIRAPRRVQELYLELNEVISALSQELGRSPTIAELAAQTRTSEEEVIEALEAGRGYRSASLDSPGPDETTDLSERLGVEDEQFLAAETRTTLVPLLAELPHRERLILHLRFFRGLTQSEIAKELDISQMHVSRLLARSLARLRSESGENAAVKARSKRRSRGPKAS